MARTRSAQDAIEDYNRAKQVRNPHDNQFRLNAAYCLPREYNKWGSTGSTSSVNGNTNSDVQARFAFDNTGVKAIPKYGAICKRLINPDNIKYHSLAADDDALMRLQPVRVYFDTLTDKLFKMRREPTAKFGSAQSEIYKSLGVYGTSAKTVVMDPELRGFRYMARPLYDLWFLVDDDNNVTDVFRRFALTKRSFKLKWPNDNIPVSLKLKEDSSLDTIEFVHVVSKRGADYDKKALGSARFEWASNYLCVPDIEYIGEESGFLSCPYIISAVDTVAGDPYGYSPAEQAFPALGGVNAMKKTLIKLGHKAADPPLLANDDGVLSGRIDQRPGRVTYGGLDKSGRQMVREYQTGANFRVAENLIEGERKDINDSFLVSLFEILTDTPEMTAAQVYERIAEKAALFAPTMAMLQERDQGPQIEREIALLAEHGLLPEMPPELIEAKGKYRISYTNPMNKALHASEVSGFARWVQMLTESAMATQDPTPLDWVDWDTAAPDIADKMDVRSAWIASESAVKAKREGRAQQQQTDQLVKAAPAVASVAATASKQGMVKNG